MELNRTLRHIRIRDDFWNMIISQTEKGYHKGIQEFFEEAITVKLGMQGDIMFEIEKTNKEISKLQELNKQREKLLKNNRKPVDALEETRKKSLLNLIKTGWEKWTPLNKKHAIEVGKFKDKEGLEKWVKEHQG